MNDDNPDPLIGRRAKVTESGHRYSGAEGIIRRVVDGAASGANVAATVFLMEFADGGLAWAAVGQFVLIPEVSHE